MLAGTVSTPQLVTIQNTGTRNLRLGSITKGGANPKKFAKPTAGDGCSEQLLVPAGSCTVAAVFKPTGTGTKSATLLIPSNDFNESLVTVTLIGTGTP